MNNCFWFITGSQHLYGTETINQVNHHSSTIVNELNKSPEISYPLIFKPAVTTPEEIRNIMVAANNDPTCLGIITWMHTFSPGKMWISGLSLLKKPLLHLHTQFNEKIPWETIDMNFMNLNQSAHGDREYGFIGTRMNIQRKVLAGHWQDNSLRKDIGSWMEVAHTFINGQSIKIARFGDNMRQVAVTEGDKIEAQLKFGWETHGFGISHLVDAVNDISPLQVNKLMDEYYALYSIPDDASVRFIQSVREQARIELGLKTFLKAGGFTAFTTTFEDLHGLKQLPGLAVQRLMAAGFGFGGEGDWKTAALTRIMKLMSHNKGTSFMEDYTYHLEASHPMVLGSHMLEVCPTISKGKPRVDVKPLGIGGKEDPARLIFEGDTGSAICASLIDLGHRFRLIINEVNAINPSYPMPNLPVATVTWQPKPSFKTSAEAWIYAGGAHHTVFSFNVTAEQLSHWALMSEIECVTIDHNTHINDFCNTLRWNDVYWKLRS